MRYKLLFLSLLFVAVGNSLHSQWDAQISQYWKVKTLYNPAFAGATDNIELNLLHRMQWVGVDNAPRTSVGAAHMPLEFLGKQHGVGLYTFNGKMGLFSNTIMSGQYAYKFDFKKGKTLNIGLQGGMADVGFDANKIYIPEDQKGDIILPTGSGGRKVDFGFGVSWITPDYYVGLSTTHLLEPEFELDDNYTFFIARTYYLIGQYNIRLIDPFIVLQPSVLLKTDGVATQCDITAKAEYKNTFNGGISWRKDDGFVFLLGIRIGSLQAGYSYDYSTSEISNVSHGSHEFSVGYSIPIQKKKTIRSHKSIRLL